MSNSECDENKKENINIYDDVARLLSEEKDGYAIPDGSYGNIKSLCKKYKENNK